MALREIVETGGDMDEYKQVGAAGWELFKAQLAWVGCVNIWGAGKARKGATACSGSTG